MEGKKELTDKLLGLMRKEMEIDAEHDLLIEEGKVQFGIDFRKAQDLVNMEEKQRVDRIFKDPKLQAEFADFMLRGLKLEARLRVLQKQIKAMGERLTEIDRISRSLIFLSLVMKIPSGGTFQINSTSANLTNITNLL